MRAVKARPCQVVFAGEQHNGEGGDLILYARQEMWGGRFSMLELVTLVGHSGLPSYTSWTIGQRLGVGGQLPVNVALCFFFPFYFLLLSGNYFKNKKMKEQYEEFY